MVEAHLRLTPCKGLLALPTLKLSVIAALAAAASPVVAAPVAQVDSVFERFSNPRAPGCAVAVDQGGATVFQKGYGAANLAFDIPISPDTAFDIASTTKQFTAAAILLLAEDGKLSLDDDVHKYLPELADYGRSITIRQMLNHTSGLRDFVTLLMFADVDFDDVVTPAQAMQMLAQQKALDFMPGERRQYSNSGYFLAGQIVERVSGQSLRDFAQQRLFGPLGMTRTVYNDRHNAWLPQRASGYTPDETDGAVWRLSEPNWEVIGDGGIVTTVGDLLIWNRNFRTHIVGGPRFSAQMEQVGILNSGASSNYSLGLMVDDHDGQPMVHHGGSWGGYRAELIRFPKRDLSVAVLCNSASADASALAIRVADLWLDTKKITKPAAHERPRSVVAPADRTTLAGWVGVYRNADSGSLRTVELKGGHLEILAFGGRYALTPRPSGVFELVDGPFEADFSFAKPLQAPAMLTQSAMERTVTFQAIDLAHPTTSQIAGYAGDYDCPELGVTYRIRAKNGVLSRTDPRGNAWTFDALDQDAFGYGNLTLHFTRDAAQHIIGATLDIGRVRNLACKRL